MTLKHRIYYSGALAEGKTVTLDDFANHHIANVLRLKAGDEIILFNGQGGEYPSSIINVKSSKVTVKINAFRDPKTDSPLNIHLGQGISRGERMDFAIQKSVELGVKKITPLFTERCNIKLSDDRLEKRLHHWARIAIHACQQSGRCLLPKIEKPQTLKAWLNDQKGLNLICHPENEMLKTYQFSSKKIVDPINLLIGPEGGLTDKEVRLSKEKEFQSFNLGPRILRTETAPIVALTLLQYYWGDLA